MNRIFIVGSQRSGTTLLRLILGSHPLIHAYEEPDSYNFSPCFCKGGCSCCRWVKETGTKKQKPKVPFEVFKVPKWTHYQEEIFKRYPSSDVIFLYRNPLDVVSSMLSLPMKGSTWVEKEAFTEITECYPKWTSEALKIKSNNLKLAVLCVFLKQQYISPLAIKFCYGDLVENPESELRSLLIELRIPWNNNLLRHHLLNNGIQIGKTNANRSIDSASKNKHLKVLTPEQIQEAKQYLEQLASLVE
jgi:hypothetical protein